MISSIRGPRVAGALLAAGLLLTAGGLRSLPPASAGPAPSFAADTLTTLEGVYTEEQAQAGKQVYDVECSLCHGPREFGGRVFQLTWSGQPLSALYRHISLAMPLDNPGGLAEAQYVSVLAYILELNGFPAGERPLPSSIEELQVIQMERLPEPDTGSHAGVVRTAPPEGSTVSTSRTPNEENR